MLPDTGGVFAYNRLHPGYTIGFACPAWSSHRVALGPRACADRYERGKHPECPFVRSFSMVELDSDFFSACSLSFKAALFGNESEREVVFRVEGVEEVKEVEEVEEVDEAISDAHHLFNFKDRPAANEGRLKYLLGYFPNLV